MHSSHLDLPEPIGSACRKLFEAVPFGLSMPRLQGSSPHHRSLVEAIVASSALAQRPDLEAGLWLYVDDLETSHRVSQKLDTTTGSFWHAIMHRREGDFGNSRYWLRRCADHSLLLSRPDLDPASLVDAVEAADARDVPALVQRQRAEWGALFEWCVRSRTT